MPISPSSPSCSEAYFSKMSFVLVWPLMLAILPTGQSCTEEMLVNNRTACCRICPPGYYSLGTCNDTETTMNTAKYRCERCSNGTFTDRQNSIDECRMCGTCPNKSGQMVKKPCMYNSNTVCTCKEGFFNRGNHNTELFCVKCSFKNCEHRNCAEMCPQVLCKQGFYQDNMKNCQPCLREECRLHPECKMNCLTTTSTTTATTTSTSTSASVTTVSNGNSPNPKINRFRDTSDSHAAMLILLVVLVTVLLLVSLWLFTKTLVHNPDRWHCWWSSNKEGTSSENCKINEHQCHQPSNATTLTLNIREEIPLMSHCQSQAVADHSSHIIPLVLDTEGRALRQEKPSEHWPAAVLYAIIKEVPLRRWKEFLRLLSVADQQLERVELEAGLGVGFLEKQYQMLRLWSQRPSAALDDIYAALHYMDLAGCAQLLQESIEQLQWKSRSEVSQPSEVQQAVVSPGQHRTVEAKVALNEL